MNARQMVQYKKEVEYLLERARSTEEPLLAEGPLVDFLAIRHVLEKEAERMLRGEYHEIEIDFGETKKEVKKSKDFQVFKVRKTGDILQIEHTKEGTKCLITQKEIEDRVEAPCGHVFNREGIVFLYENTRKVPKKFMCPHAGCERKWKWKEFFL